MRLRSWPWRLAFRHEILSFDEDENRLTEYAKTKPCEGLAEFGALAMTDPVLAKGGFPECWAVWRNFVL